MGNLVGDGELKVIEEIDTAGDHLLEGFKEEAGRHKTGAPTSENVTPSPDDGLDGRVDEALEKQSSLSRSPSRVDLSRAQG